MRRYGCTVFRMKSWKDRVSVLCRNGGTRGAGARLGSSEGRGRGRAGRLRRLCESTCYRVHGRSTRPRVRYPYAEIIVCASCSRATVDCAPNALSLLPFLSPSPRRFLHFQGTSNTIHARPDYCGQRSVGSAATPTYARCAHVAWCAPSADAARRWEEPAPRRDGRKVRHPGHFTSTSLIFTPVASCPIWTAP